MIANMAARLSPTLGYSSSSSTSSIVSMPSMTSDNKLLPPPPGLYGLGITLRRFVGYVISFVVLFHVIGWIGNAWAGNTIGYEVGNRRRFISVLRLELVMIYLSVPMYVHIFSYFQLPEHKTISRRLEVKKENWQIYFTIIVFCAQFAYLLYFLPTDLPYWFCWPFAVCLGLWKHLTVFSLLFITGNAAVSVFNLFGAGRAFISLVCRFSWFRGLIYDRRKQVAFSFVATIFMVAIQWFGSDRIVVKELNLKLKNFPPWSTLHVAVVTDVHSGFMVTREEVAKVVDRVNAIETHENVALDAVFLVGDMVDAPRQYIEKRLDPIRHFRSRLGTFFVSGNHEFYYGDYDEWKILFKQYGIHVLENEFRELDNNVCLVGLHDISAERSGIYNTSMDVSVISKCPANESVVVLAHNPAATAKITSQPREVDLILSGHTHAGQYYIFVPYVYFFLPYLYGLYQLPGLATQLLVSAGTLYQAAPLKMVGMSEIWLIKLTA